MHAFPNATGSEVVIIPTFRTVGQGPAGLPSGVDKVARPSNSDRNTITQVCDMYGTKTFGSSKTARLPGMCRSQTIPMCVRS
jgi:hypothetical protein